MDKIKEWEAHTDYIRYLEVHPNRPLVLSCSDDMSIKMWDWEKDWDCVQVFEGHSHYVMMVRINPRDTNTFASASLDKSIKVWGLTAGTPHFSLDGPGSHEKGVNCVDYYPGGDKPYLLSGADDRTIKIWDYQTKACLQTLEGHAHNISSVCFHPRIPIILSASEDGTVRLWHAITYRPETTLNYGLERAWCIAVTNASNKVAIGYDEGTIVIKLGNERPVASLDTNSGKLVWARNHDIQTISLRGLNRENELVDGERVSVSTRDLGACEVYPQSLAHNCNGSFIVVCGDGEYIIYTSQALRNKAFGSALDFVWSSVGSGDYAIRESISRVRTFKNFKDNKQISLPVSSADGIFSGHCLGVKGPDCVLFYTWDEGVLVRKIDVVPTAIYWNETGDSVVLACQESFYVLRYNPDVVAQAIASGSVSSEEGVDGAFELVTTVNERVHTAQWVGECFLFTNNTTKLQYMVGGELMTLCHLTTHLYLLGYVPKEDRVFLIDKSNNIISYKLLLSVLSYQTAVVREDFDTANALLPQIPRSEYNSVAKFLESQGYKQDALAVTQDDEHKFELAIDLKQMDIARKVLLDIDAQNARLGDDSSTEAQSKWRRLGDLALFNGDLELAETCARKSGDASGLLLMCSCTSNREGMKELAGSAKAAGRLNVAFLAYFLTGQVEEAIELLIQAHRLPEAALLARTYLPSQISRVLSLWKDDLKKTNAKAAEALADPAKYPNLFPDLDWALKAEQLFLRNRHRSIPPVAYSEAKKDLDLDLIELLKSQGEEAVNHVTEETEQLSLETPLPPAPLEVPVEISLPAPPSPVPAPRVAAPAQSPVSPAPVPVPHVTVPEEEDEIDLLQQEEDIDLSPSPPSPVKAVTPTKSAPSSPIKPVAEVTAPRSPVPAPSPARAPLSPKPEPTPVRTTTVPQDDEDDLDALLEEDEVVPPRNPSPVKTQTPVLPPRKSPSPEPFPEEEEDVNFDDLDNEGGFGNQGDEQDLLEKDDDAFDSAEDW
eukprot:scaffold211_cov168-Ochromonas_danica.AAC.8